MSQNTTNKLIKTALITIFVTIFAAILISTVGIPTLSFGFIT